MVVDQGAVHVLTEYKPAGSRIVPISREHALHLHRPSNGVRYRTTDSVFPGLLISFAGAVVPRPAVTWRAIKCSAASRRVKINCLQELDCTETRSA